MSKPLDLDADFGRDDASGVDPLFTRRKFIGTVFAAAVGTSVLGCLNKKEVYERPDFKHLVGKTVVNTNKKILEVFEDNVVFIKGDWYIKARVSGNNPSYLVVNKNAEPLYATDSGDRVALFNSYDAHRIVEVKEEKYIMTRLEDGRFVYLNMDSGLRLLSEKGVEISYFDSGRRKTVNGREYAMVRVDDMSQNEPWNWLDLNSFDLYGISELK